MLTRRVMVKHVRLINSRGKSQSRGLVRAGYIIQMCHNKGVNQSSGSARHMPRGDWTSFADFKLGVSYRNAKDAGGWKDSNCP